MRTKLTEVIAATRTFVKSSNPEDPMFVVNFNEKVSLGLPAAIRYIRLQQVLKLAEQSSAMIYSIGIFDGEDPDRNTKSRLARATGGEAFFPGQLSEVVEICDRIARDTRNQYTIGYVPANTAQNDSYRAIRVVARAKDHGKLSVRARAGYIAAGAPKQDQHDHAK